MESGQQPQAGDAREWQAQVAASWLDLRAWLAERRRLLREPALALAPTGTLAFGPVRFAVLVWVVWPALIASAIGTVAAVVAPPPPSRIEVRHAAAQALEREAIRALGSRVAAPGDATGAGAAAELRDLHRQLLRGVQSEADIEPARVRYGAALDRYVADGAPRADKVLRHVRAMRKFDEIPVRLLRAGLGTALGTLLSGLILLLAARSFRRRLRKSPMAHAARAERAYLYLLPASTLGLTIFGGCLSIAIALLEQVPSLAGALTPWLAALILVLTWCIYWRRAPMIAGVVSDAVPPARTDVRAVRIAVIASSVVSFVQVCVLLFVGYVAIMFLGLLLP